MKRKAILSILITLAVLASLLVTSAIPVSAASINVPSTSYPTIQAAIDDANPGDTIIIASGTYEEQLDIDKDLILHGAGVGETIILSPDILSNKFNTPLANKPIIYVHNNAQVTIEELTIDGDSNGNANYRFEGIAFYNAGGLVQNAEIIRIVNTPLDGAQHGVAIYAFNDDSSIRSLTIFNNDISDFQKNGIAISGIGLSADVQQNTVTGAGDTASIAQNGIQISYGATGLVHRNEVSDIGYTGAGWTACGILVFEANDVSVKKNEVLDCQTGIGVETHGWYFADASYSQVVNNVVENADYGITVTAYSLPWSSMDSYANNNKISNNTVTSEEGEIGIYVGAIVYGGSYIPEAVNNKIVHNTINGFDEEYIDEGTATKIRSNIYPIE